MSEAFAMPADDESMETGAPEQPEAGQAGQQGDLAKLQQFINSPNIAEDLEDSILAAMGAKVVEEFDIDLASRTAEGYDERIETALKLAKLAKETKTYPWPNAANVKFPLVIQAAIQFNARSYPALIDGPNIVKGKVEGQPTPEKAARAQRIGQHMSYQLLDQMEEWEDDTDQLLLRLAIVGTLVRKAWFDPILGRNTSAVLGPDQFVVNYKAKRDLSVCPRSTQRLEFYPHEIIEKKRAGYWLDVELGQSSDDPGDDKAPHEFLEQHTLWDLDGDDYPEPYIITVHRESRKVVRVVARYDEDGVKVNARGEVVAIQPTLYFTKYGFIPDPDGGFYDIGFGTLLGPMGETINSVINQLMDAGHLANVQGGFIGEGVSLKSGNMQFKPGEWKKVQAQGQNLSQQIVPLPVKEPSSVLFQLLGTLIEAAKDVTATQDILTGDASKASMPVGTTVALIEQGLKTFTAIVKRIHRAFKKELQIYYDLNSKYLDQQEYFTFQDQPGVIAQQDYKEGDCDVVPVSDPNMATDMQRAAKAQFVLQFLGKGLLDDQSAFAWAMQAAGITEIQSLLPKQAPGPDPKLQLAIADSQRKDRETAIKEAEAHATIALDLSEAQLNMVNAVMASPQLQSFVAQFIEQRVTQDGMPPNGQGVGQIQPQNLPGMAPGQGQPANVPVPGGPPPGANGPMGPGPGNGPGGPIPGAMAPGAM